MTSRLFTRLSTGDFKEKFPEMGTHSSWFNYIEGVDLTEVSLQKKRYDTYSLILDSAELKKIKLTNCEFTAWNGVFISENTGRTSEVNIESIDLSSNSFAELALDGAFITGLKNLTLNTCTKLEELNLINQADLLGLSLERCVNLKSLSCMNSTKLRYLSLKDSSLTITSELLKFIPYTAKKGLIDLRGNYIDWNDSELVDIIRGFLYKDFAVQWDKDQVPSFNVYGNTII